MKSKIRFGVLVSPCVLSPGFQVEKKLGSHWGYQFIRLLMKYDIDIVPLPCPESTFGGYQSGLQRKKHGIDYYSSLEGYEVHCRQLAIQSADMVADMCKGGYCFICLLGVEHSPTCAVNYMYSHQGMLKREGIFWNLLQRELCLRNLKIPQIGINRRYSNKSLLLLEQRIEILKRDKRGGGF